MLDIETLDVSPSAVILTIGAQGFDPFSDKFTDVTYYERLDLESQDRRTIDDSTLEWWGNQAQDVQDEALGDEGQPRIPLRDALEKLSKIIWQHDRIWANGVTFDMVILENAFKQQGLNMPWKYWQVMDARTVFKMVPEVGKLGNNHNALADCVNQIDMVQKAFKILNITTLQEF